MKSKEVNYFDLFIKSASICDRAAAGLNDLMDNLDDAKEKSIAIHQIEHEGDEQYHVLYHHLNRSFITPIETDVSARRVLRAIIDLCRSFNMSITAEGVETAFQAEFLREANCDRLQGYYFARPGALPTDVDMYRRPIPGAAAGGSGA